MAATGRGDLIASYYTLTGTGIGEPPRFSFEERVAAAAKAGFAGIGLLTDDYLSMRAEGRSAADLRAILDHHGIGVFEIEFLFDWTLDGERGDAANDMETTLHEMADVFSPHHVNVGDINGPEDLPPLDVVTERFARICDRAAQHGTSVALEFLPWTGLSDLGTGWDVVREAGRPNGGLVIDAWHYFRGRPDEALLRSLPPSAVVGVQMDDADEPTGPPYEDTVLRRRLPGEGTFDLVALVRALDSIGVDVPYSVEIIATDHQALPVEEAASRAHDSTAALLATARA